MNLWNTSALRATGLVMLAAGSAFLSQNTSAATVIADWGGDYESGANNLRLPATPADNGTTRTYKYSSSVFISPTGAGYVPPAGKSGTFYGALQLASAGTSPSLQTFNLARVADAGTTDQIIITGNFPTAGNSLEVSGVIAFQKPNFLNSMSSSSSILFDSSSSFSMSIASSVGQSGLVRLAVLDGSQWYLSNSSYTTLTAGTFSIANLNAENFGTWNLTSSSAPLPTAPTTFTTGGSTFSNIQAVGYYFDYSTASTSQRTGLSVTAFTVSAVPEPSTVALLGVGVALVIYRKRRTF